MDDLSMPPIPAEAWDCVLTEDEMEAHYPVRWIFGLDQSTIDQLDPATFSLVADAPGMTLEELRSWVDDVTGDTRDTCSTCEGEGTVWQHFNFSVVMCPTCEGADDE